jgi:predicted nucleic acid-binding protein
MIRDVILDAGPLVAALDASDVHHAWAVDRLKSVRLPLITCEAVLAEAYHLVRYNDKAIATIGAYLTKGLIESSCPMKSSSQRVLQLMNKYSDVPMSFADACIVSLVEETGGGTVLTTDSDFKVYRQRNRRVIRTIAPETRR